MTSAWKPIPRPRGPVSSSDPVRLTIETRWPGPSRSVFRLPEADHVPAKASDSPGASAPSGPLGGPEHALQSRRAAGTSHHGAPLASLDRHRSIPWPDPSATMLKYLSISRRSCQSALGRSNRSCPPTGTTHRQRHGAGASRVSTCTRRGPDRSARRLAARPRSSRAACHRDTR